MTLEDWKETGIEISAPLLYYEAGLEWVEEHTTVTLNDHTLESIKALPSKVKLFLTEFAEIMQRESGIESESIHGLSQSFQEEGKNELIMKSAKCLLSNELKSNLTVLPARKRWM